MSNELPDTVAFTLRQWLRNERRLGMPCYGAAPALPAGPAASSRASRPDRLKTGSTRAASPRARAEDLADSQHRPPVAASPRARAEDGRRSRTSLTTAAPPPPLPTVAAGPAPAKSGAAAAASPPERIGTGSLLADDARLPPLCTEHLSTAAAQQAMEEFDARYVRPCVKCRLHEHRTQTVFGVGSPRAELVFVGEGPGADEDARGEPFVGRAGQLLTRMIAAMTLTREQVYIGNIVKCRPPGNRTPTDDEMETCVPYLFRQLAILRPRVIVTLGRPAAQTLLATKTTIGRLRGNFFDFPPPELAHLGLPVCKLMPTFHPAYLLRSPDEKAKVWADLQQVMRYLGLKIPRQPAT